MPKAPLTKEKRRALLEAIRKSPSYIRASQDVAFLNRDELRPIRLQLELLKPEMLFTEHQIHSTVVVFGSARIHSYEEGEERLRRLKSELRTHPRDKELALHVKTAQRLLSRSKYYEEAKRFAALATRAAQADTRREFVIVTGGGPGIMEAANRGAYEAGGKSIGLNITLPHEQDPNPYITPELCLQFHYFALRKMHFLLRSKALVVFPGGFGTIDKLFETLTLVQTGKKERIPILLFGPEFWDRVIDFRTLALEGMIAPGDLKLFSYVETAEEAWGAIQNYWRQNGMHA